jgi:preprotein translocase subunit SecA
VLVGSISIEKSEKIAELLKKSGIPYQVLNAKQHEREAKIIAQAGRKGAVTVSTNMAGRGTDILLGGNPEAMTRDHFLKNKIAMPYAPAAAVIGAGPGTETPAEADANSSSSNGAAALAMVLFQQEGKIFQVPLDQWKPVYDQFAQQCRAEHDEVVAMGGLHILGTERHEARRIDNQLRGRAGRQGDPGSSRFFLSLEDDLMRIFGGEKIKGIMHMLGMKEGIPIESKLISKRIETAQKNVEAQHFESRKHLLEYDDVMNKQRETIYSLRKTFLEGSDQKEFVLERAEMVMDSLVETFCPREQHPDQWNVAQFSNEVLNQFGFDLKAMGVEPSAMNYDQLTNSMVDKMKEYYAQKETLFGAPTLRWLERHILLDIVDAQWKDHLLTLDHLKEGIGLRGYGQKDPLVEFKREAFTLFEELMDRIDTESVRFLFLVRPAERQPAAAAAAPSSATGFSSSSGLPSPAAPRNGGTAPAAVPDAAPDSSLARQIEQRQKRTQQNLQFRGGAAQAEAPKPVRAGAKVGRNDPCPCGSGKKYKKCHGMNV